MPRPISRRGRRPKVTIPVHQIHIFYMPARFSFQRKENPSFLFSVLALEYACGTRLTPSAVSPPFLWRAGVESAKPRPPTSHLLVSYLLTMASERVPIPHELL